MTIFNTDKWYETKIAEAEKQKLDAEEKLALAKQKLINAVELKEIEKELELLKNRKK
jgi:hypothetical protein